MNPTTPQSMSDLPELPEDGHVSPTYVSYYTADQMREYGRLCRATAEQAGKAEGCSMGVGCDEAGVCYAAAHGSPERCAKPTQPAATPNVVEAMHAALLLAEAEIGPYVRLYETNSALEAVTGALNLYSAAPVSPSREVEALSSDLLAACRSINEDCRNLRYDRATAKRLILLDRILAALAPVQEKAP